MVDTDIVFVGDVTDLFQTRNFDYGVTIRDNKAYPVQGGVQFVPKRGKHVGAAEFSDHTQMDLWKSDLAKRERGSAFHRRPSGVSERFERTGRKGTIVSEREESD